ncbi:GNAT family N-acetyltransferase [Melissospora conviva]|uniref:GNAT family N-acetyltransferase n=1 Tax=Melissospora conviva TaxID=3388432 RepID=UPI003B81DAAE
MSRRLVSLTLDTLEDLPRSCRACVYWELDPVAADRACAAGDPGLEKEAWVSQTLLEWGSCGKLVYVDGMPAGFVMYAPPAYVPRSMAFPTSPVSADAALLTTAHVVSSFAGGGLGRMLVQGVARDLTKRGIKAIEAFGDAEADAGSEARGRCLAPADFYLSVGFKTVRPHPRFPRLRLELRTALSWKSDVEYALEKLLGSMSPETLLRPVRPAVSSAGSTVSARSD